MADEMSPKEPLTPRAQHADKPSPVEAFDRIAANLRQQWEDDGLKGPGDRWEDEPVLYKVSYLADFAVAYGVSFERFAAAARHTLGMMPGQEFTADHKWYVAHEYYTQQEKYAMRRADEERLAKMNNRSDEVGAIATSDRNDMPTPEEGRKLTAEWTHDYGLRRMEDRGVKYEDEAERKLNHAAARGTGRCIDYREPVARRPA